MSGWIGVDFDGTLAVYGGWPPNPDPAPVTAMLERVKAWLRDGREVRIVTARVCPDAGPEDIAAQTRLIQGWCRKYLGQPLVVTCIKDFSMVELWDDRCVQVEANTGRRIGAERVP